MRPVFFWMLFLMVVLVGAFLVGAFLIGSLPRDPAQILFSALVWLAAIALAWYRWATRSGEWLGRLAAALVVALLALLVLEWMPRTDVFVVYRRNCPPRTSTFWPLFLVWLSGAGLLAGTVWGRRFRLGAALRSGSLSSAVWWLLFVTWTLACGYVLANNISIEVLRLSLLGAGKLAGGFAVMAGGMLAIGMLFSIPERRIRKAAAADFERMGEAQRQAVLELVDLHARRGDFVLWYHPDKHATTVAARVGGDPLALPGESWPMNDDGSPGIFLLQLPLVAPLLDAPWQNRLATVFLINHELCVRSYDPAAELTLLANPLEEIVGEMALRPLAIPYVAKPEVEDEDEDEDADGFGMEQLMERIPELEARLRQHSQHPVQLLDRILAGSAAGFGFLEIVVGGDPSLIQGPHEPACPNCGQSMRFLFQFDDVTEDGQMGDCGVGYVYGCDTHPDLCLGFVDCY